MRTPLRRSFGVKLGVVLAATFALVQLVAAGAALANAANPNPDTTGTATVNANGTVTVDMSGTWSWPGQTCEGRYGEGYAIDWWGISSSPTPANPFSLTNATEVTSPGVTTTGTISPVGSIQIKGQGGAPNTYFHVAQYYAGEDVNSSTTCTDTGSGGSAGSTGSWSAMATYPSKTDLPPQICVNMYDEHGNEGQPSGSANDFSPSQDNDNSIQTNNFNPAAGMGYCVVPKVVSSSMIKGEIYSCVNGAPTTTLVSGGTITVPAVKLTSANPLAATKVSAGTYTMYAHLTSGFKFVSCGVTGVTIPTPTSAHQTVTVPTSGTGNGPFYAVPSTPPPPKTGYVEVCESSANGVTGTWHFTLAGKTITVPTGACSPAIKVPSGPLKVCQVPRSGFKFVTATTTPSGRLISIDLSTSCVSVTIVPGGVSTQTIVTFIDKPTAPPTGTLKVCEVAGSGVSTGTDFVFTSSTGQKVTVPAGPAPGGYCVVVGSGFRGDVTVTQAIPSGDTVSSIAVAPASRLVAENLPKGTVTVAIGSGVTEVTYTDT